MVPLVVPPISDGSVIEGPGVTKSVSLKATWIVAVAMALDSWIDRRSIDGCEGVPRIG
jgi:hypothetical protein